MTYYRLERFETIEEPSPAASRISDSGLGEGAFEQLARLEGTLTRLTWDSFAECRRRAVQRKRTLYGLLATLA